MLRAQGAKRNAFSVAVAFRGARRTPCALGDPGLQLAVRHDFIDQPPLYRALTLDALLDGAEVVGVVTAHLALVDHAGQPPGARQHRQQRHFRQRHRRRAVIGENDVIGRQRQFITAAGRGAIDDGDETLPGILAGILQAVAGFVGEFAEVHFVGVGRTRQHADVGAGAEHPVLARAQQHHLDAGMLEAQPLHRIGQFDVDAEIVGIQLELIAFEQPAILIDIHGQRRDVAFDVELPMPIPRRIGLKIDVPGATSKNAIFTRHGPPLGFLVETMHNNA